MKLPRPGEKIFIERDGYEVTHSKPEVITPKNVCYWYEKEHKLSGSQKSKAKKFLQLGLVEPQPEDKDCFIVQPIPGYNTTPHHVIVGNRESCTCQFNSKVGKECSHIMAVKLYKYMEDYNETNNNN